MSKDPAEAQMEKEVEKWKVKKLIKNLEAARGNGTSMISLMLTPKDQLARMTKMLNDEYGTASNIKSHVNKLSVLTAITSVLQRLKLYNRVPPNGLVIFCGTVVTEDTKEKKVTIDFEPFKPISRTMYMCDNKFHTEPLNAMLESDDKFGFIIMDGNGTLFGLLQGNAREVLHKFTVELPKKHGRGGQSALRFSRLRLEKRHNYLRKVAELATQLFITNDKPNVTRIVLAGSADFKNDLSASDLFDVRLQPIVAKIVDVAYGGENGFNQAVDLASDVLGNVRFIQEMKLVNRYFQEIALDNSRYVYGVDDTLKAIEMGAVSTLIVWEDLPHMRITVKIPDAPERILILSPDQIRKASQFQDEQGNAYEREEVQLVEWLAENYKRFGCNLEFVTNKTPEGTQFVKGFGGIGGFLRYQVDFRQINSEEHPPTANGDTPAHQEEDEPAKASEFTDEDFM